MLGYLVVKPDTKLPSMTTDVHPCRYAQAFRHSNLSYNLLITGLSQAAAMCRGLYTTRLVMSRTAAHPIREVCCRFDVEILPHRAGYSVSRSSCMIIQSGLLVQYSTSAKLIAWSYNMMSNNTVPYMPNDRSIQRTLADAKDPRAACGAVQYELG